jgi:hypothetical protein
MSGKNVQGDNESDGVKNATHNTFSKQTWVHIQFYFVNVLWVAFPIPSLVKYPVRFFV